MCTDRTLKNHFRKYASITEEIEKLQALKEKENIFIKEEMKNRGRSDFDGIQIISTRDNKSMDKKALEKDLQTIGKSYADYSKVTSTSTIVITANVKKFA